MATLGTFDPPYRVMFCRGTLGVNTNGVLVEAYISDSAEYASNSAQIYAPAASLLGCNVVTASVDLASPSGGGANFLFTRDVGTAIGIPARFGVDVYHVVTTDGVAAPAVTDSSAVLTMSSTSTTSTTVAIPADTDIPGPPHVVTNYNVRLTKVEIPWILA